MHKKLVLLAFEKAKGEENNRGVKNPSDTSLATNLSVFIKDDSNSILGEKSLRNYYKSALKETKETNIKQAKVVSSLCKYLGYETYQEFCKENGIINNIPEVQVNKFKKEEIVIILKKNKIRLIILFTIILIASIIIPLNRTRFMIWQNDHYIEVSLDLEKYDLNQLKVYKEERILNFKQIKNPDCETKFFKEDGSENVWYEKNANGELEYFTALGLHPVTGETLKKITKYMVRTHICETYK